jgi:hypothetical protein
MANSNEKYLPRLWTSEQLLEEFVIQRPDTLDSRDHVFIGTPERTTRQFDKFLLQRTCYASPIRWRELKETVENNSGAGRDEEQ